MALFQRKNKTTLAAEIVAEMQKAGMANSPLGNAGGYNCVSSLVFGMEASNRYVYSF